MSIGITFGELVGHWLTIASVSLMLLIWALWSGWSLWRGTGRLIATLRRAARLIERSSDERHFAQDYETIATELKADPVLGPRWREYDDSLVARQRPVPHYRSTARAANWFDIDLLRTQAVSLDLRYHAALPNLLVGAGLLFTFFGLAVALSSAGGVVSGEAGERTKALKDLLDAASFKFITSLIGLFLSIAYALFRKIRLKAVDGALDTFLAALEARVPLLTPVALQQEANDILREQSDQLQAFSTELALNIGQAFDQAFDKRLGEHVQPLTEAMQQLAAGMASRNEDAVQTMLDSFLQRLQGGAGDRMQGVTESLERLSARLEGLQSGLGDAAVRMGRSADAMAARMGEGAEAALARITEHIGRLADTLRAVADQTRGVGAAAGQELLARIEAAAGSFEATATKVAAALETAASETGGALGRGAQEAVERIAAATEGMRGEMRALIEEFRSAAASAGDTLRTGGAAGADALRASLGEAGTSMAAALSGASERLASAGEQAGAALQRGGEAASVRLQEAGAGFSGRAEGLARQLAALASAADGIVGRLAEFERAARDAMIPLAASAADLKSAGQAARGAVEPLVQSAQTIGRTAEQIGGVSQRIEATQAAAGRLAEHLSQTVNRFEGVDKDLALVLGQLQTGLQGFRDEVTKTVTQTDANLGKAATFLGNAIKDLEEVLETFAGALPSSNAGPNASSSRSERRV